MSLLKYENVLVKTDHFTKYAQAYPTKSQTAVTNTKTFNEKLFVCYSFPEKLRSAWGRNI